jgi:hypothetical protein
VTQLRTRRPCRNCGRDIAYAEPFRQWYHMLGFGRFCERGARP